MGEAQSFRSIAKSKELGIDLIDRAVKLLDRRQAPKVERRANGVLDLNQIERIGRLFPKKRLVDEPDRLPDLVANGFRVAHAAGKSPRDQQMGIDRIDVGRIGRADAEMPFVPR